MTLLAPLRRRPFRLLFAARATSLLGTALAPTALAFAVIAIHGSPTILGVVVAAGIVPYALLALVGGAVGDRLPRNLVMVVSDLVSGVAQAAAGALLLAGAARWWELAVLSAVRGTASAFFGPASDSIVPQTVEPDELQAANTVLGFARSGTMIVGTAAAGILVSTLGAGWALIGDAATYVVGVTFLIAPTVPAPTASTARRSLLADIGDGWREVKSRLWLWPVVVQFSFVNALSIGAFLILGPYVSTAGLGGARSWGLIMSSWAVGLLAGGVMASRLQPRYPLRTGTAWVFLVALPPLALALGVPLPFVLVAAVLGAAALEVHAVFWFTTLQQRIAGDRLARVMSYDAIGSLVLVPVGTVVIGLLAGLVGRTATLYAGAVIAVLATAAVLLIGQVRALTPSG